MLTMNRRTDLIERYKRRLVDSIIREPEGWLYMRRKCWGDVVLEKTTESCVLRLDL